MYHYVIDMIYKLNIPRSNSFYIIFDLVHFNQGHLGSKYLSNKIDFGLNCYKRYMYSPTARSQDQADRYQKDENLGPVPILAPPWGK